MQGTQGDLMSSIKSSTPNNKEEWISYYQAIKRKNLKDKFQGGFPDERSSEKLWWSIVAYQIVFNNINLKEKDAREKHIWYIGNRSTWGRKLEGKSSPNPQSLFFKDNQSHSDKGDYIERYRSITGQDLADERIRSSVSLTPHHLISHSVAKAVHSNWKKIINKKVGYSINCAENLVILPNIADIACYLKVPLHEGSHVEASLGLSEKEIDKITLDTTASLDGKAQQIWNNKANIKGYHSVVMKLLTPVLKKYFDQCHDFDEIKFIADMNRLSRKILRKIGKSSLKLSPHGDDYVSKNLVGCANKRMISSMGKDGSISESSKGLLKENCKLNRNHDYLEELFTIKGVKPSKRKKMGFVVSSQLKYQL